MKIVKLIIGVGLLISSYERGALLLSAKFKARYRWLNTCFQL